jgi:AAA+ superfamily predicted ATPase
VDPVPRAGRDPAASAARAVRAALAAAVRRRSAAATGPDLPLPAAALDAFLADAPGLAHADAELEEVGDRFDLDPVDRRLLAAAVLPELHPAAHLLTGLLSGDPGAGRPSVAVALELAGLSVADPHGRARLGPAGRLRRTGLLALDGDDVLPARRLRLPDRVAARLLGGAGAAPEVARVLCEAVPVDVPGADELQAALAAGEPLTWVHAPLGSAGTALAAHACRALGVEVLAGDLEVLPAPPGGEPDAGLVRATVHGLVVEAGLCGAVLVVAGAHVARACLDELDRAVVPVVALSRTPWDARWRPRLPASVTAGRLTTDQREWLWHATLGPGVATRDVLALRLTPEQIVAVARRARQDAELAGHAPGTAGVREAARRLSAGSASRARPPGATATLDDLVLPPHTRREVERLVGWVRDRDDVLAFGDLHGKGGKGTGISVLFSGSPGTGKTLAAHVVADSVGADLFQVDLSTVVDKYIGETEKNLERVFAQAEELGAVLFFDEADSLFGSRSAVNDARDRYANQEVAYLLQRMEHSECVTILATNMRGNLDPAFARRLHVMVHFPDPDPATRELLWRHHVARLPGTDERDPVDAALLAATLDLAGGDIRNVVLAAAYDAVAERRQVGMRDLRHAADRELAKLGRRAADPRRAGPA